MYTLYHNYYSICSIMMRYLLMVRGPPVNDAQDDEFQEHHVDIFNEGQLEEYYLCDVNPLGQVCILRGCCTFLG